MARAYWYEPLFGRIFAFLFVKEPRLKDRKIPFVREL